MMRWLSVYQMSLQILFVTRVFSNEKRHWREHSYENYWNDFSKQIENQISSEMVEATTKLVKAWIKNWLGSLPGCPQQEDLTPNKVR